MQYYKKMFLDIEMNMGQMLRDVKLAVNGKVPVEFFNIRYLRDEMAICSEILSKKS